MKTFLLSMLALLPALTYGQTPPTPDAIAKLQASITQLQADDATYQTQAAAVGTATAAVAQAQQTLADSTAQANATATVCNGDVAVVIAAAQALQGSTSASRVPTLQDFLDLPNRKSNGRPCDNRTLADAIKTLDYEQRVRDMHGAPGPHGGPGPGPRPIPIPMPGPRPDFDHGDHHPDFDRGRDWGHGGPYPYFGGGGGYFNPVPIINFGIQALTAPRMIPNPNLGGAMEWRTPGQWVPLATGGYGWVPQSTWNLLGATPGACQPNAAVGSTPRIPPVPTRQHPIRGFIRRLLRR